MNKQHIQLSLTDRGYLEALMSKGELKAKTYRRALAMLELEYSGVQNGQDDNWDVVHLG